MFTRRLLFASRRLPRHKKFAKFNPAIASTPFPQTKLFINRTKSTETNPHQPEPESTKPTQQLSDNPTNKAAAQQEPVGIPTQLLPHNLGPQFDYTGYFQYLQSPAVQERIRGQRLEGILKEWEKINQDQHSRLMELLKEFLKDLLGTRTGKAVAATAILGSLAGVVRAGLHVFDFFEKEPTYQEVITFDFVSLRLAEK
jgi:hypothetical protein